MRTLKHAFSTVAVLLGIVCAVVPARAQLSGNYTIGSGGDYTSFAGALAALGSQGVSGPVHFDVLAGTYNEYVFVGQFTGVSATNTVTFDGGAGNAATRVLTYAITWPYGAVLTLDGADYVRFRNLTIASTGPTYGYAVKFCNSADYNEITDCVITMPANTTSNYHRGIVTAPLSGMPTYGDHGSYNLIKCNAIINGYHGIWWYGFSRYDAVVSRENRFIGNTVEDFYYDGINLYAVGDATVRENTIIQRATGTYLASAGTSLSINYCNDGLEVSGNYSRSAQIALRIFRANFHTPYAAKARVFNNMAISEGGNYVYGIYTRDCRNTDIVHNSARASNTNGYAYGIYVTTSSVTGFNIANNLVSCSTAGVLRPIYVNAPSTFNLFDYNIVHSTGSPTVETWIWDGVVYSSLAALQAAVPGFHQHSMDVDPEWSSNFDLHSSSPVAWQGGLFFTEYDSDYDGEARANPPCIGADEYVLCDIVCPENITTANDAGVCGAVVNFAPTTTQGCGTVTSTPPSGSFFPVGSSTVTCVTDAGPQCSFTVTVQDAEAPVITPSLPLSLWPVDHGYETVTLSQMIASLTDNCDALLVSDVRIVAATSDEAETGGGSGNTLNDIVIANDCRSVDLRRERAGTGDGRVYTIYLAVTDAANNTGTAVFKVHVSHNVGVAAVEGSAQYSVSGPCGTLKRGAADPAAGGFALDQNYPNPFNPSTTIRFTIPRDADVRLHVFDIYGRRVAALAEGRYAAGSYLIQFDGSSMPSGHYVCRLEADGRVLHRSMLLAK